MYRKGSFFSHMALELQTWMEAAHSQWARAWAHLQYCMHAPTHRLT